MTTTIARNYAGESDQQRMCALVAEAWARYGPHCEFALGDIGWRMYGPTTADPQRDVQLWEHADGKLLGFAWFLRNGYVDLFVHPREHCSVIVPEMLAWARERLRTTAIVDPDTRRLTAWSLESDTALTSSLTACGLEKLPVHYLHLARTLDEPLPSVALPAGYTIRSVAGTAEGPARAAVHRASFGSERMRDEIYARVMGAPHYRGDLDVVAVAPDGSFAAMALAWFDTANRVGEFEPVGTAPGHRRLGLARACIVEGLRRLQAAGALTAVVGALRENAGSAELYESLGFRIVDRNHGFARPAAGS